MAEGAGAWRNSKALLNESFEMDTPDEGSVVKGKVIAIEAGQAIIDVGYKMEGRVELKEFASPGEAPEIAVGDEVEVYLAASRTRAARR
jgi:small subunit ribosomal protein S1